MRSRRFSAHEDGGHIDIEFVRVLFEPAKGAIDVLDHLGMGVARRLAVINAGDKVSRRGDAGGESFARFGPAAHPTAAVYVDKDLLPALFFRAQGTIDVQIKPFVVFVKAYAPPFVQKDGCAEVVDGEHAHDLVAQPAAESIGIFDAESDLFGEFFRLCPRFCRVLQ